MEEFKKLAVATARNAGELLAEMFNQKHQITFKGEINLVTEADKMSEDLIINAIHSHYPDHGILAEESVEQNKAAKMRWIIDPLDGTTNYAHGFPVFCVSIALEINGTMALGVIYDPLRKDLFVAVRGEGAYLNEHRLHVSTIGELSRSLLATGFPYDIRESKDNNLDYFTTFAKRAQAVRRAGAAALDLAYVAAGRFDGFWELKLMSWDMAAGCLLVEEAGGVITDLSGGKWTIDEPNVLATNGLIHEQMLDALRKKEKR